MHNVRAVFIEFFWTSIIFGPLREKLTGIVFMFDYSHNVCDIQYKFGVGVTFLY